MSDPITAILGIPKLYLEYERDKLAAEVARAKLAQEAEAHRQEYGHDETVTIPHEAYGLTGGGRARREIMQDEQGRPTRAITYGGGRDNWAVTMPALQRTRHVPGLKEKEEKRHKQTSDAYKMGAETGRMREDRLGREPGPSHDKWMQEQPSVERLQGYMQRLPDSLHPHVIELIDKVNTGEIKTRRQAYGWLKAARPNLLRDIIAEQQALQSDPKAPGEAKEFVKITRDFLEAGDFAETLFNFPETRRGEAYGPTYEGPRDSLLQRSRTGEVKSVVPSQPFASSRAGLEFKRETEVEKQKGKRPTGGLTKFQENEAVRKIREELEGIFYDNDGKPRAPTQSEIANAQRYAAGYGHTFKIIEVEPGEKRWYGDKQPVYDFEIVPLAEAKKGLQVEGGPKVAPRKYTVEEIKAAQAELERRRKRL